MFFIFNKDKVMSYIVTVFTVAILFFTASVFSDYKESVQTSTNIIVDYMENDINDLQDENVERIK